MRIIKRSIIGIATMMLCLGAVSCKKDNTIQYNNVTMGNIVDGKFISDQGNVFNVVEQNCYGQLDTLERAFIICDVLNKTAGGNDNEYDVRLNLMNQVLVKDIVALGSEADEEVYVENPVHVEYLWISGGYINMYVMFPYKPDSKTAHMINLVQQECTESGKYIFRVTHNAYGEVMDGTNDSEFVLGGGYVSFPINSFMKEDEATIKMEWKWYVSAGSGLSQATEYKSIEGTYKKDGYEHVPSGLIERTKAALK